MIVELFCSQLDEVIASVKVPHGHPVALTGVIDLPAGDYDLSVHMYHQADGGFGGYFSVYHQVIVGQVVGARGCTAGPVPE